MATRRKSRLTANEVRDLAAERLDWPNLRVHTVNNWFRHGVGGTRLTAAKPRAGKPREFLRSTVNAYIDFLAKIITMIRPQQDKKRKRRATSRSDA